MKILVQDLDNLCFLAADGRWVSDRDNGRDFYSLLPAYSYARDHTTRRFQVLLYCPEDNFCVSIITGAGQAHKKIEIPIAKLPESRITIPVKPAFSRFNGVVLPTSFDDIRRHLN